MLRNQPIRRKLMTVILLTSGAVLLPACGTFLAFELLAFRQTMVRNLSTVAQVVAANSTAALAFDDRADATDVLSALAADRHIVAAGLYDTTGTLFAKYPNIATDDVFPTRLDRDGYEFEPAHLVLQEPVVNADRRLGTLVLKADLGALYQRLSLYGGLVAVAIVLSCLVAFPLSNRLQRHISRPVLALAAAAKRISEANDYSVRAAKFDDDEFGQLADAFNAMLAQVQEHDTTLRESEERFRMVVEGVTDYAIIMLDPGGYVISWNAGAERINGYRAEEIIGQHFSRFCTSEDVQQGEPAKELEVAAAEGRVEDDCWRVRKDGSRFWASVVVTALHDEAGGLRGFSKITRDITERKRAEEALRASEERFAKAFQVSPDAITISGISDGRIFEVNDAWQTLFGLRTDEVIGRTADELNVLPHPADREWVVSRLQTDGYIRDFETVIRRPSGEVRQVSVSATIVVLGGDACLMSITRDVTDRKQAEDEIRTLNAELEQRVQERTRELAEANKELESFSYSVSHDLRAPLRHVQGYVEMLHRATEGQLSAQAQRYLTTITEASVEMGQLIDDLLAFSRTGRTEMTESRVDLDAIVHAAIRNEERATKDRHIVWQVAPLPPVIGDASLLKLAVANLVGNAVKYSRQRDPARIEIGCAGEEGGRIVLFVRDNGAGFDMHYVHKLFGVFQRLHRAEEFEGTGIGLATVRRIVARHGGRVWAEGAVDQGAAFYFTLKRSPSA